MEFLASFADPVLSGLIVGAMTWGAVRTEMRYLRRDLDELRRWRADHDRRLFRGPA